MSSNLNGVTDRRELSSLSKLSHVKHYNKMSFDYAYYKK